MARHSYLTPQGCWRIVIAGGEAQSEQSYLIAKILPINPVWLDVQQSKYIMLAALGSSQ
jgi:hypothetical protein